MEQAEGQEGDIIISAAPFYESGLELAFILIGCDRLVDTHLIVLVFEVLIVFFYHTVAFIRTAERTLCLVEWGLVHVLHRFFRVAVVC